MKSIKFWIGMAVSAALVWWAFAQVEIDKLGDALAEMDYVWLAACVPVFFLQYVVRAIRWKYLLKPLKDISYEARIASTVIGFTGNMLLPARLGEIIRAIDLGRREKVPKSSVLATILLERIFDGLAIIPMFLVAAWSLGVFRSDTTLAKTAGLGAAAFAGIYVIVIMLVVLLAVLPNLALRTIRLVCRPLPDKFTDKLCLIAESVISGLMMVKKPGLLAAASGYTIFLWLMLTLPVYMLSMGAHFPISYTAALFVNGLVVLFIAVPSSPGFVGTMHAALLFGLSDFLGMPEEKALALAIVFHGGTFVFTVLYCLKFLIRGQVSLFDLGRQAESSDVDSDPPTKETGA